MRRGLLVLAALALGFAAVASATEVPSSLDPAEVHNVLTSFLRDISEELKGVEAPGRRLLEVKDTPPKSGLPKGPDGPKDEKDKHDIHDFFGKIFGKDWAKWVPSDWSAKDFDWAKLGDFTLNSNLQSFVDTHELKDLKDIKDITDLDTKFEDVKGSFCKKEKFTPSEKVPTTCVGPQVTLAYVPKVCVLDDKTHQVICDPAKLVLVQLPGSCTHKYWTASTWKGKECKISGQIGFGQLKTIGGEKFTLDLKDIPDFKIPKDGPLLPWKEEKSDGEGAMKGDRAFDNLAKASADEPKI